MIKLVPDRPRQYNFLKIPAFAHHIIHCVFMTDMNHVLRDNGSRIKVRGHVMTGSADYLYTSLICWMIRTPAGESRKEGMMDIDNALRVMLDKTLA